MGPNTWAHLDFDEKKFELIEVEIEFRFFSTNKVRFRVKNKIINIRSELIPKHAILIINL